MSVSARSNVYALVIGINLYQAGDYPNLRSAVNDANAFERFLLDKLNVPSSQIINLRDEEASRESIVDAFSDGLLRLTSDCPEPAIIIYYAGHGARTEKPEEWETWATNSSNIELLCPSDIGLPLAEGSLDVIDGIPDRTICHLLNRLSRARGNNITLILDCCCSAGINRSATGSESDEPDPSVYIPRRIQKTPPLSPRVDESIYRATNDEAAHRNLEFAGGFTGLFQDSHVLMAACGQEQQAYENEDGSGGIFTQGLLSAIESCGVLSTTYDGLLTKLNTPKWQTPHFHGKNMNRLLFSAKGSRSDPFLIPARKELDGGLVLEAGSVHGVVENTYFDIHQANILDLGDGARTNPSLGRLIATRVDPFRTQLAFPSEDVRFEVPSHFYARWGDHHQLPVTIYSSDPQLLHRLFPEEIQKELGVHLAKVKEQASLVLTLEGDTIHFDRNDTIAQPYIGSRFPQGVPATCSDTVYEVVRRWRTFNYHLTRPSPQELTGVRIELQYLQQTRGGGWDEPDYEPFGENLLSAEPATIQAQGGYLGITIYNESDTPLYPFLLYFDPNDLTIASCDSAPQGAGEGKYLVGGVDCPLPPYSKLPLGYGNGGAPWEFILEGKEKDVGFFKLFVTRTPTNFALLEQSTSPFDARNELRPRAPAQAEDDSFLEWGSKTYTLVQVFNSK